MSTESKPIGALEWLRRERAGESTNQQGAAAVRTQRSYEFICDWFKRSSVRADQLGAYEVALMWMDGLHHLESMREQRDEAKNLARLLDAQIDAMREQRDELLAALHTYVAYDEYINGSEGDPSTDRLQVARAAIAKVTP